MSNFEYITKKIIQGRVGVEDFREMYRRADNGLMNPYWAVKRADMKSIRTPAFITGSEFSSIHTMGSLRGFMELGTEDKWLRWSATQEWYDLWAVKEHNDELVEFFDFFLKGKQNGWREKTPKCRMSLLRFGQQGPIENVVVPDFPLPQTDYRSLYFAPEGKLLDKVPTASGLVSYQTQVATDIASFTYTFDKKTTLCGLPKAVVYMSCQEADDLCVGVQIRKLGSDGKALKHLTIPFERAGIKDPEEAPMSGIVIHTGPVGFLRASHRAVDPSKSMHPQYPYHPHEQLEKVPPGTVVKLEIGIFMMGSQYEAGESVRVDIMASNPLIFPDSTDPKGALLPDNKGRHKVHFGGEYPSCIILPFAEL